ncbi:MBL fold metallo-hydrolase [Caballeronia concitans]|uniref:Ribonuclease Z n=1 Tax=Caballeronia concitans TaxID=1777133 RepID=A0A658R4K4_9BURK|nr:MBL fold metallo-hydrolase [Caballeronia concitans]SAL48806.1 ribonuclease Z [Caballeronia concitans]
MNDDYLASRSRRTLLRATGAGAMGVLSGALLGPSHLAWAEPLTGAVPTVDKLSIRVVTDSSYSALLPGGRTGTVDIVRFGLPLSPSHAPGRTLENEWGLSLLAHSTQGAQSRQVLIDFGYTPGTLNNNLELLKIDPAQLDALLLTHGHYDHFGGMVGFLQNNHSKLKTKLPIYLGGEECFCTRENRGGQFGSLDRQAMRDAGLVITFAERPAIVADHAFTTGWIDQMTFEKPINPSVMTVGMRDGVGCAADKLPAAKQNVMSIPDDFEHEQSTAYLVKDRGLVVLTSCAHRGVLNSVRMAMKVSGVAKVHAIIGGFHLTPQPLEYQQKTVDELKAIDPDYLIPMHCSGQTFYTMASQGLPGKVLLSSTGTQFTFGA